VNDESAQGEISISKCENRTTVRQNTSASRKTIPRPTDAADRESVAVEMCLPDSLSLFGFTRRSRPAFLLAFSLVQEKTLMQPRPHRTAPFQSRSVREEVCVHGLFSLSSSIDSNAGFTFTVSNVFPFPPSFALVGILAEADHISTSRASPPILEVGSNRHGPLWIRSRKRFGVFTRLQFNNVP